jgi:hypothetical protein
VELNGIPWLEVTGVSLNIDVAYTDVQRGMDLDGKMTGRSGTGTLRSKKAYSRAPELVEMVKAGNQPTARLVAWLADPDAEGAQQERWAVSEINFTTIPVLNFDHGNLIEEEMPFRFAPGNLVNLDRINAPEV